MTARILESWNVGIPGRTPALALASVLLVSAASCGGSNPSATVSVRDSAGVTIVTNSPAQMSAVARWRVGSLPSLKIASPSNGPYTLFQVGDVVPLSGRRIAVANAGTSRVLLFGADGKLQVAFGKRGEGPGEFRRIGSLAALPGDSIAVLDEASKRLSVFDDQGRLRHDAEVAGTIQQAHGALADIFRLDDGDLVLFTSASVTLDPTPHPTPFRGESGSVRITSEGTVLTRYGAFPGQAQFSHAAHFAAGNAFFGARTDAVTDGDDLVVGTETLPELRVYGPSGSLKRVVRWPDHPRTVTRARLDSVLDILTAGAPEAQRAQGRSMLSEFPRANQEPPYRSLVTSDDGDVWVGDYDLRLGLPGGGAPARHWLVFARDGRLTATISTPVGFEPRFVRDLRVVGVYEDSLGVESIRAYPIQKNREPA